MPNIDTRSSSKALTVCLGFLFFVGTLSVSIFNSTAKTAGQTGISETSREIQQKDRILEQRIATNEPVKIVAVKNKRAKLEIGAKFRDDDEWFKEFSLELINTHHGAIQFVSIALIVPRPNDENAPPVATSLTYGVDPLSPMGPLSPDQLKKILPGQTVTLALTDIHYQNLRMLLKKEKYDESITRIKLKLEEVLFEDGTKWIAGMFFKRDEENPDKWIPLEKVPRQKLHHPVRAPPRLGDARRLLGVPSWMTP